MNFRDACWRVLTEVPGWPDAPRKLRMRRLLPIALPVGAIVLLLLWTQAWALPRIRAERTVHQPLLSLEQEIADLQTAGSDTQAAEVAAQAAEAARSLLKAPKQLMPTLAKFAETARAHGWDATFHPVTASPGESQPDPLVHSLNARGRLVPATGNAEPFTTLLVLLERFSPPDQSIDLTRLSLRADEQGRLTAEVYLRAGSLLPP